MSQLTITQDGRVLTETIDGVTMPADYSFATVNDYVHSPDRNYEELECLCLGMASHMDKLVAGNESLLAANRDCIAHFEAVKADYEAVCGQRDDLMVAAETIEINAEECLDFDGCTAILVSIDDYHKLMEAIAAVRGAA